MRLETHNIEGRDWLHRFENLLTKGVMVWVALLLDFGLRVVKMNCRRNARLLRRLNKRDRNVCQ